MNNSFQAGKTNLRKYTTYLILSLLPAHLSAGHHSTTSIWLPVAGDLFYSMKEGYELPVQVTRSHNASLASPTAHDDHYILKVEKTGGFCEVQFGTSKKADGNQDRVGTLRVIIVHHPRKPAEKESLRYRFLKDESSINLSGHMGFDISNTIISGDGKYATCCLERTKNTILTEISIAGSVFDLSTSGQNYTLTEFKHIQESDIDWENISVSSTTSLDDEVISFSSTKTPELFSWSAHTAVLMHFLPLGEEIDSRLAIHVPPLWQNDPLTETDLVHIAGLMRYENWKSVLGSPREDSDAGSKNQLSIQLLTEYQRSTGNEFTPDYLARKITDFTARQPPPVKHQGYDGVAKRVRHNRCYFSNKDRDLKNNLKTAGHRLAMTITPCELAKKIGLSENKIGRISSSNTPGKKLLEFARTQEQLGQIYAILEEDGNTGFRKSVESQEVILAKLMEDGYTKFKDKRDDQAHSPASFEDQAAQGLRNLAITQSNHCVDDGQGESENNEMLRPSSAPSNHIKPPDS